VEGAVTGVGGKNPQMYNLPVSGLLKKYNFHSVSGKIFQSCSKILFSVVTMVQSGHPKQKKRGVAAMDSKKYLRRMRELREDHDYGQKQVAASLNIDQRVYSRYETGINSLPVALVYDLCEFYGVSADYLLGRSDRK